MGPSKDPKGPPRDAKMIPQTAYGTTRGPRFRSSRAVYDPHGDLRGTSPPKGPRVTPRGPSKDPKRPKTDPSGTPRDLQNASGNPPRGSHGPPRDQKRLPRDPKRDLRRTPSDPLGPSDPRPGTQDPSTNAQNLMPDIVRSPLLPLTIEK